MPVESRQHKSCTSTHSGHCDLPHPVGRHYMSQNYIQQHPSDRLYQIAIQATVAKAEASKSANDEHGKINHDSSVHKLNKIKVSSPSTNTHINNTSTTPTTTTTTQNLSSKVKAVHLTPQQWQLLTDYHEHDLFVRTRSWSFCMAVLGVGVALFGIGSPAWKWIGDSRNPYELGLWTLCLPNNSTCLSIIYHLQNNWKLHISIICLLGCACLFGILGLGLAITGVCKSALILRLYYYHSAGECFLVSSIAIIAALILYPISAEACIHNLLRLNVFRIKSPDHSSLENKHAVNNDNNKNFIPDEDVSLVNIETQYGYTYFLTWIAALFFFNSFICMNLDLLIQSFVRPIPIINSLINNLMPCCGLSTSTSSQSPISSTSSHSYYHNTETINEKPKHETTLSNIGNTITLNNNHNNEYLHSTRKKLIKCRQECVSFDDSITENSQHQLQSPTYLVPNILLSDYDKEYQVINPQNTELHRKTFIDNSSNNNNNEIVVISDAILQDSSQEGEWI
ncbi:Transmembrane 47 isoform 1 [Schistosoma japonicum]|uniref:Transmembrane 47 isoform 1 n=1 Tax=Schistosoma japonicum TaxID=6182 RepID=A0A4Z2DPE9_SCHJA|nr:Transmembrane 47 [Schistosoma japonicum]KAH8867824.1 Transmembrane 47 [Schistosoma japonicum]TNN18277.1 Transmembrane 47 isoform 1 [Schistosoma japonicum]